MDRDGVDRPEDQWDDGWDAHGELDLDDGDDRLPWLESDEEEPQARSVVTGRLAGLVAMAVLLLGAVVGGIWFVSHSGMTGGPEPDGSLIAAPEGPYKVKPDEEGGKTFAGTGDTSFAVGEGQKREGRLAERPVSAAPKPTIASTVDEEPRPAQPSGVGVQVGAYFSRAAAEAGWQSLVRQTEALSGVSHRVVEGQADIGRVYRLQAVAGSRDSAQALCNALREDGLACQVK